METSLLIRPLSRDDIPFAEELRRLAGWNQTRDDWLRLLTYQPDGCFLATCNGRPAGTVTTTSYGAALAWIGMMLVHPDFRRQGIATALMRESIAFLHRCGVQSIKLDATPEGEPVYQRLGFEQEWPFHRWRRPVSDSQPQASTASGRSTMKSLKEHAALDSDAFGADRMPWLNGLRSDSLVALRSDGFGMLRPGANADYLGPVVAQSHASATQIVKEILSRTSGPVLWDVPAPNRVAEELARSLGFTPVRQVIRMQLGPVSVVPRLDWQFAIADLSTG